MSDQNAKAVEILTELANCLSVLGTDSEHVLVAGGIPHGLMESLAIIGAGEEDQESIGDEEPSLGWGDCWKGEPQYGSDFWGGMDGRQNGDDLELEHDGREPDHDEICLTYGYDQRFYVVSPLGNPCLRPAIQN